MKKVNLETYYELQKFPGPRSVFMLCSFIPVACRFNRVQMPMCFSSPIYWLDKCTFGSNTQFKVTRYRLPLRHPESF